MNTNTVAAETATTETAAPAVPPRLRTTIDVTGLPEPVVQSIRELVDSLLQHANPRPPLMGRFAYLGYSFPKEMIDEGQREMWANFPREFPEPSP